MIGPQGVLDFDGSTFDPELDSNRLNAQCRRVFRAMLDGRFHTLGEIARRTGDHEQSVSARFRDFRKDRFHIALGRVCDVQRKRVSGGVFEYRLVIGEKR